MSSPILRGGDLRMSEDASDITEVVRQVLMPIWNAYSFFTLYANADGRRAEVRTDSDHVLDRYVLAKAHDLVADVTARMDALDIAGACHAVTAFIDALNNWYIRRSRERFWGDEGGSGSADAQDTLYTVLTTLMRVAAPLLPLVTEEIYRNLTGTADGGDPVSVHLADWPDADELPADPDLVRAMDRVRDVCTAALFLREDNGLRTRLPLASLVVAGADAETLRPYVDLVREEVNVKVVELTDDLAAHAEFILKPNGRILGPKLGADVQKVMAAARSGEWTSVGDHVEVAGHSLEPGEYELTLRSREGEVSQALRTNDAVVVLDVDVTPELAAEGRARDLVRLVQQARKDADLVVTDRIEIRVDADGDAAAAVEAHRSWIAAQVLATSVVDGAPSDDDFTATGDVDGTPVTIGLRRAE
jgi:isoleucyl-tRNA synthetase